MLFADTKSLFSQISLALENFISLVREIKSERHDAVEPLFVRSTFPSLPQECRRFNLFLLTNDVSIYQSIQM